MAIIVLPEPTSPCKRRLVGAVFEVKSPFISLQAFFWESVNLKGRVFIKFVIC